jgi:SAM-dependent methyltransferase
LLSHFCRETGAGQVQRLLAPRTAERERIEILKRLRTRPSPAVAEVCRTMVEAPGELGEVAREILGSQGEGLENGRKGRVFRHLLNQSRAGLDPGAFIPGEPARGDPDMATALRKEQALEEGLVQTIFRPCAEFLIARAEPQPGERLLDVGCGSGIVARVAIERQPQLSAAHGFDAESAAVRVAESAASSVRGGEKLRFWTGNAREPEAYRGRWNVCVAQHVVQHVPEILGPLRAALADGGRAMLSTWPVSSAQCPAYHFLYSAAGEGEKRIGMPMEEIFRRLQEAGFRRFSAMSPSDLRTPPVDPRGFLKQYLLGKLHPPADVELLLGNPKLKELAASLACGVLPDGRVQFRIAIQVIVAHA